MKISFILNILLLIVAAAAIYLYVAQKNDGNSSNVSGADALENIYTRVSVRKYTAQKVEADKTEKILRAGMSAPSAMNRQPWAMVVVDDPETLDSLHYGNAPLAIVVCGDMTRTLDGDGRGFWVQDVSAATENIHHNRWEEK